MEQPDTLLRLNSFAVALFTIGQGHLPLAVELKDGKHVYVFQPEARSAKTAYFAARDLLDSLQQKAAGR